SWKHLTITGSYRKAVVEGKTDIERTSLEAKVGNGSGFNLLGGVEYDLFMLRISQARALARIDRDTFAASAEFSRTQPVLSADSIFLYFATAPKDSVRARIDFTPLGSVRYYVQALADHFALNLNSTLGVASALDDEGLTSGLSYGGSAGLTMRK